MTLYDIKPGFQALLRPLVKQLATMGITANQVTIAAAVGSVFLGAFLFLNTQNTGLFLLLPVWMFLRMALNAIDGMLAREHDQKSALGSYLNELCDVVSDTALYIPFVLIYPFDSLTVGLVIFLSVLSEYTGVLALSVGATRRYDGPLGKSDRAFIFGALGLWVGTVGQLPGWLFWLIPIMAALLTLTITNRIKNGLKEKAGI